MTTLVSASDATNSAIELMTTRSKSVLSKQAGSGLTSVAVLQSGYCERGVEHLTSEEVSFKIFEIKTCLLQMLHGDRSVDFKVVAHARKNKRVDYWVGVLLKLFITHCHSICRQSCDKEDGSENTHAFSPVSRTAKILARSFGNEKSAA